MVAPHLSQTIKEQSNIEVGNAVPNEKHRITQHIMAKLDVEWRLEIEPFIVASFIEHDRRVVIKVAMEFNDFATAFSRRYQVRYARYLRIGNTVNK